MKALICYGLGAVLGLLGILVTPESVRDARRLWRIRHEGIRVDAEILRIEEELVSTSEAEQGGMGPSMIVEHATVRYSVGGRPYEARHGLPAPIRTHRPGHKLAILLLPDDPAHAYPVHSLPGSWMTALLLPPLLLLGAAVMGGVGTLFGRATENVSVR